LHGSSESVLEVEDGDQLRAILADRTATQYDQLLASYCRLSVSPSVTLCIVAFSVGTRCRRSKVVPSCSYSTQLPVHFFRHFCFRIYCL